MGECQRRLSVVYRQYSFELPQGFFRHTIKETQILERSELIKGPLDCRIIRGEFSLFIGINVKNDRKPLRVTCRLQGLRDVRCDSILRIVNSHSREKAADVLWQFRGDHRGGSQVILKFLSS